MDWLSILVIVAELLGIIVGGFFIGKFLHFIFVRIFKAFASKTKTSFDDIVLEYVEGPVNAIIIVILVFVISNFLENLNFIRDIILKYAFAFLALLVAYTLAEFVGAVLKWYYVEGRKKADFGVDVSILPFIRKVSRIVILLLGITYALSLFGIEVTAIFAITSVVAIVLGLASQESLANIFAGMTLQLDRPCKYDEVIRLASGEIVKLEKIGTRSTRLEDIDGKVVVLSNSEFAKQRIVRLSSPDGFLASLQADVPLHTEVKILEGFLKKKVSSRLIQSPSISVSVEKVGKDTLSLSITFIVADNLGFKAARTIVAEQITAFLSRK